MKDLNAHKRLAKTLKEIHGITTTPEWDKDAQEASLLCESPEQANELHEVFGMDGYQFGYNVDGVSTVNMKGVNVKSLQGYPATVIAYGDGIFFLKSADGVMQYTTGEMAEIYGFSTAKIENIKTAVA